MNKSPGRYRRRCQSDVNFSGFTIVELLIVIVIIGILAAITIVAYNGITNRAHASAAQADANAVAKLLGAANATNGSYPTDLSTINNGSPMSTTDGTTYAYHPGSGNSSYCVTVTNGSNSFKVTDTATSPVSGGCPGDGVGGVAAITNLATNPSVETNGNGWSPRWFGASGGAGTTTLTSAAALYGGMGYRKTWTTGGGGQDIGFQYVQVVTAGKTYTFSAYIRPSVVTGNKAFVQWQDSTNTTISTQSGPETNIPANTWQRLSVSGTAPANTVRAVFVWGPYPASGSPLSVAGQTLDFDGVMITEGLTLYNYADGSSSNWIWSGTANSSSSTGPAP